MTLLNGHEGNEMMDQQEDSGEQTDSGISSTFTTDIEQMFAETVNNVRHRSVQDSDRQALLLFFSLSLSV